MESHKESAPRYSLAPQPVSGTDARNAETAPAYSMTPYTRHTKPRNTIESIDTPLERADVHVLTGLTLADIDKLRKSVRFEAVIKGVELFEDEDNAEALDEKYQQALAHSIHAELDDKFELDDQADNHLALRHNRAALGAALAAGDEAYEKMSAGWMDREARQQGLVDGKLIGKAKKIGSSLKARAARVSAGRESRADGKITNAETRAKRRELRKLGKLNGGLVPRLLNEKWGWDNLESIYDTYKDETNSAKIQAGGGEVDEENQSTSAYTEAARHAAMHAVDGLVAGKNFSSDDEADAYRNQMNKDIYDYVRQSPDTIHDFNDEIARYIELRTELQSSNNKERLSTKAKKAIMGSVALAGSGISTLRQRWSNHHTDIETDEPDVSSDEIDEAEEPTTTRSRWSLRNFPTEWAAKRQANRMFEEARVYAMSDEERTQHYKERKENRRKYGAGLLALGAVAISAYLTHRYGFPGVSGNSSHHTNTVNDVINNRGGGTGANHAGHTFLEHDPNGLSDNIPPVKPPESLHTTETFTQYRTPSHWAFKEFGSDYMPHLHELADKAKAAGHDVELHGTGRHAWYEVDGSSATPKVLKVLSQYK
jgi:hypothetical protein